MPRPNYVCSHLRRQYSPLEKKFLEIIFSDKELKEIWNSLNILHEWRFQGKDALTGLTKKFTYWLDFFCAKKGIDLEIHHNGHKKGRWFMPNLKTDVFSRDNIRKRRLAKRGVKTIEIYETRLTKGWIRYYLRKILSFPDFTTLDKWF